MFPLISSMRAAARSKNARINGRHVVHVVGPNCQRDLGQLGTVKRPVNLDRRNVGRHDPCERNLLHVVVTRRRLCRGHLPRQRSESLEPTDGPLKIASVLADSDTGRNLECLHRHRQQRQAGVANRSDDGFCVVHEVDRQLRDA